MSLIGRLGLIVEECGRKYAEGLAEAAPSFACMERFGGCAAEANILAQGDNEAFMGWLLAEKGMGGRIDLIYIDPPFFSGADYAAEVRISTDKVKLPQMKQKAYHDTWENGVEEYLRMLTARLFLMRDLLSDTGGIWVHLDWHVVHYVKIIMDEIFGEKNFINEVIWNYKSGGVSTRHFARKHDTLLYYAKSKDYYFQAQKEKSYNRGYKPYRFKGVKEYKDELGWYTMVNRKDVWQIDMVGRTSSERTGYATQKPEQLIRQILESCTKEGDLCADFFCGSGTLAATAEKMGRRWICCDIGPLAVSGVRRRMALAQAGFSCFCLAAETGNVQGDGKVFADVTLQPHALSDTMILSVTLRGYQPQSLARLPIGEEQRKTVKKILKKDPLSLVDHWAVDLHYDGEIFSVDFIACRRGDQLELTAEVLVKDAPTVGIKVCDVFGGGGFLAVKTNI